MTFVTAWLQATAKNHPQHDFYQLAVDTLEKKRLPTGCTERDFMSVVRRFIFDCNPYLRAPFSVATRSASSSSTS
jgi:hypothetical protein